MCTYIHTMFWDSPVLLWGHKYISCIFLLAQRLPLTLFILPLSSLSLWMCEKSLLFHLHYESMFLFLAMYRILDWQFFFSPHAYFLLHSLLVCVVFEKSAIVLIFISLSIMCILLKNLAAFKIFLFIISLQKCKYDISWCDFFSCFFCLVFIEFMGYLEFQCSLSIENFGC